MRWLLKKRRNKMKTIWVELLVSVLITMVITSGLYVLTNGTPEMVAVVLTLLIAINVALAAIIVPTLVGWVVYRRFIGGTDTWTLADSGAAWVAGTFVVVMGGVIMGAIWSALSSIYSYILPLLTR